MIYFYQLLLFSVTIIFLPFLVAYICFRKSSREGLGERFTIYNSCVKKRLESENKKHIWVHAASVGEVKLLGKIPQFPYPDTVVTCTTSSGKKVAQKLFPGIIVVLLPLDFVLLLKRFRNLIKPSKVLILETELWPGFIYSIKALTVIIINGRLSRKKFPIYYFFRKYFRRMLEWVNIILVKDRENFIRYRKLGIPHEKLKIMGDLKYMFEIPHIKEDDVRFRKPSQPVIICGSTHHDEERILIDIFKKLRINFSDLSLIISPRHLERLAEIKELLIKNGLEYTTWAKKTSIVKPGEVVLIDSMGELAKIYSLATITFIGGSLVPIGGHNIIEPAVWKAPIVTGPYFDNFRSTVNLFKRTGGVRVAENTKDLYNILLELLNSPQIRKDMGEKNFAVAMEKKREIVEVFKKMEELA